jgi:uncharacterized protein (TIGR04222 family)
LPGFAAYCEGELMNWNPFDWTGSSFLLLYASLATIVIVLTLQLRSTIGPGTKVTHRLTVLELAYLAGGASRVGDAALLRLISDNAATVSSDGQTITVTDADRLVNLMRRPPALQFQPGMTRQKFQETIAPIVERVRAHLQELGYSPTDDQMMSYRMTFLPFVILLMVFGIIKVMVGSARHHPVEFLVFLVIGTAFAGFVLASRPKRTRAGDEALRSYQNSHARESRAPLEHELLLAVALSGAVVLSGTAYAPVYAASRTMSSGGDGGGGCGGGGGGGCGGCS